MISALWLQYAVTKKKEKCISNLPVEKSMVVKSAGFHWSTQDSANALVIGAWLDVVNHQRCFGLPLYITSLEIFGQLYFQKIRIFFLDKWKLHP